MSIDYTRFPDLSGVYLEDSYVLVISESTGQVVFHLDAVLTPSTPTITNLALATNTAMRTAISCSATSPTSYG